MEIHTRLLFGLIVTAGSLGAAAQDTTVKHVPVMPTSAASGKQMFTSYCAPCHGSDGKGGGPAASALKVPPADLTALSKNNNGKFPAMHVTSVLRGESTPTAHGSKEMPVWGPIFWRMSQGHPAEVQQRIGNLTTYIKSLQEQ
jgi:mono/diheme cytochrome c family protein